MRVCSALSLSTRAGKRTSDPRAAPAHGRALRFDPPAHRLDETLADRQAEAGAGLAPVGAAAAIEFLENALEIGGLDARSFVGDAKSPRPAFLPRMDCRAGLAAVFMRVVEQIEQHLLQQAARRRE